MKLLMENWRNFLVENQSTDLLSGAEEIPWKKVKQHLLMWLDAGEYGFVVPRESEKLKWMSGMMSTDFVGSRKPFDVKRAEKYASEMKDAGDVPEIVVKLEWLGDDMDGTWRVDIIDGEHRAYAARLAGLIEVPVYMGYPDWSKPSELHSGKVKLLERSNKTSSSKEVRDDGITVNTLSIDGGKIVVWENSPYAGGAHSIYEFVVDESKRGQGIGSKLIDAVVQEYPGEEISGQASSLSSLKVLHNKGFANREHPNATFEELVEFFNDEGGSLNMRINF